MKKLALAAILAASTMSVQAADVAAGKAKAAVCGACHGPAGVSAVAIFPNLAGQKAAYLEKQLKAFRDGSRKDPSMAGQSKTLTDADIANLAAYYASL